eukprot:1894218-Pleurochrysis_carterae.AAC.1
MAAAGLVEVVTGVAAAATAAAAAGKAAVRRSCSSRKHAAQSSDIRSARCALGCSGCRTDLLQQSTGGNGKKACGKVTFSHEGRKEHRLSLIGLLGSKMASQAERSGCYMGKLTVWEQRLMHMTNHWC